MYIAKCMMCIYIYSASTLFLTHWSVRCFALLEVAHAIIDTMWKVGLLILVLFKCSINCMSIHESIITRYVTVGVLELVSLGFHLACCHSEDTEE